MVAPVISAFGSQSVVFEGHGLDLVDDERFDLLVERSGALGHPEVQRRVAWVVDVEAGADCHGMSPMREVAERVEPIPAGHVGPQRA